MLLSFFFKIELNPSRIYGLDILRAFAIIFTLIAHGMYLIESEIYKYILYFTFDGVAIFFVLSGFLIGGILIKLLKNNILDIKLIFSFWTSRWLRTIPNYFFILTIALLLNTYFNPNFSIGDKAIYYLFSQNLLTPHPDFFGEAWSLNIEEWFYLLMPIIIYIFFKLFKTSISNLILLTSFTFIFITTIFRYYRFLTLEINNTEVFNSTFRYQVFTRLDSLMYGVIGAYMFFYFEYFWNKYKVHFLTIGLFLLFSTKYYFFPFKPFGIYECVFSFSITSIAILFLLPYLNSVKKGTGFLYKIITIISLISYSMYLIHYSIVRLWILPIIQSSLLNFNNYISTILIYFSYWILTILISIILYKYFEIPIMNLRNKIKIKK